MNRTQNNTENTNAKSTPQAVFNYAQAAKRSSQTQETPSNHRTTTASSSNTTATSGPDSPADKSNLNGNQRINGSQTSPSPSGEKATPPSFAAALGSTLPNASNAKPSSTPSKTSRNAPVQLPRAPPADAGKTIQFGSINQPANEPPSASKAADVQTPHKPTEVAFGSLPAVDTSSGYSQRRGSNNSMGDSQNASQPHYQTNHGGRHYGGHRQHYNHQGKHNPQMGHSPNIQNAQSGYIPHHPKKPISPHMATATSPSLPPAQNISPHTWTAPMSGHGQYYVRQDYEGHPQYFPAQYPPMPMSPYGGMGARPAQSFIQPPRSKALAIIDPVTKEKIKTDSILSSPLSGTSSKDSGRSDDKKDKSAKPVLTFSPPRPVKIVDPAIKQSEEREKAEQEEAARKQKEEEERKLKEEAERKEREEKERLEAEKKAQEEKERKEREEKERAEAERKAQEEKEREEKERKEKEEKERQEREEREQRQREENERKEREQKEHEEALAREAEETRVREAEEKQKKEQEDEKRKKEEEQRIASIAATKAGRAPGHLDLSAIPPHVMSESPAQSPSTPTRSPKVPTTPMRTIEDPSTIQYPPNVKAPQGGKLSETGKIQYDPAFLLQFQPLCLETNEDLSAFQNIGDEQNDRGSRGGMQRRQTSERGGRGPRTPGSPMDGGMFRHGSRDGRAEMGKFAGGRPIGRQGSGSHNMPSPGGPGSPMQRDGSHGGRSRSGRGGKGRHPPREQQGGPTIPMDQVVPLEKSQNRWMPVALTGQAQKPADDSDLIPQDVIIRKVKSLLNKLTLEKFDSISDQIFSYAKQSEKENNGESLRTVIRLTFEKACDEPPFASMWAQLCRKMCDLMTDDIRDETTVSQDGEVVSGVFLFRKYLLNRCQSEFERGWKTNLPKLEESGGEVMMTDEYYAAAKAKRQGLGLVQFIGELYKRSMLTDRIMLECLKRLCNNASQAEDEEVESLCKLLTTIGAVMDKSPKRQGWIDVFFKRMKEEMMTSPNLSSRVKFMIQDVFDLRKSKWVPRRGNQPAPTTIAQIHQEAEKAKSQQEKESMKRTSSSRGPPPHSMSRQSSHRGGGGRDMQRENSSSGAPQTDGWSTVGAGSPTGTPRGRVNDLTNFGKTDRSRPRGNVLGPSNSPFASLNRTLTNKGNEKIGPAGDGRSSPAPQTTNIFDMLGGEGHEEEKPVERKKLQLLPRGASMPSEESDDTSSPAGAAASSEDKPKLSEDAVKRKAKNTLEEYYNIRDKKELYECVKEFDELDHRVILVTQMLSVVEKKENDVNMVCEMIGDLYKENLIEKEAFIKALQPFMEGYEDLTIDVPQAGKYVAKILVAAKVEPSEVMPEEEEDDSGYVPPSKQLKAEYEKVLNASKDASA
ncbi:uncharacterized protein BYT42DRAFT_551440 [Radiomyces spectabilis]|uniref:uncharacterized protein n=1 Tax=Radiomyces spectabilis TaxID=64574 RepID=UPI00221F5DF6|nr:uncharacterized protein BYT42DRAFT_551440 [Radiomyces spectabilis]KAI8393552.1 hypothetical protein BYT42DRAFT_551440 [Radiomyces spectabilis]